MSRTGVRRRGRVAGVLVVSILAVGGLLGWSWWRGAGVSSPLRPGILAYDAQDWPAAEKVARGRLKTHRDDAEAMRLLARSLLRQGRDQTALTIHTRLPDSLMTAEDYFLRGQALVRLGQRERGILAWRQALGKDLTMSRPWRRSRRSSSSSTCSTKRRVPPSDCRPSRAGRRGQPDARPGPRRAARPGRRRRGAGARPGPTRRLARCRRARTRHQAARAVPAPGRPAGPGSRRDPVDRRPGRRSRSLLAPRPMRPPARDRRHRGPRGPGAFLS